MALSDSSSYCGIERRPNCSVNSRASRYLIDFCHDGPQLGRGRGDRRSRRRRLRPLDVGGEPGGGAGLHPLGAVVAAGVNVQDGRADDGPESPAAAADPTVMALLQQLLASNHFIFPGFWETNCGYLPKVTDLTYVPFLRCRTF